MVVLQTDVTGRGPVAVLVTFLLTALFYAVTLHLAALFVLGDVSSQRAAYVAPVPAGVSLLLQRYGPAVVLPVTLLADLLAIRIVYRLRARSVLLLGAFHLAFAVILGLALANLFGLFGSP